MDLFQLGRRSFSILISIFLFLNLSGFKNLQNPQVKSIFGSGGAIPRANALETMNDDWKKIFPLLDFKNSQTTTGEKFLLVGHRMGSFEEFPKNVREIARSGKIKDSIELMDLSFEKTGLGGLELDINPWMNEGNLEVEVIHDAIPTGALPPKVKAYLKRNTLKNVVRHFIAKKYYVDGRSLFIEIKTTPKFYWKHPALDKADEALISEAFRVLHDLTVDHPDREQIISSISFVSFYYYALEKIWNIGRENGYDFKTYFILTTNRPLYIPVALAARFPVINEFVWNLATESDFLHGIWFDPTWIDSFTRQLNRVNERRQEKNRGVLELQISTYQVPFPRFFETVQRDARASSEQLKEVTGLIFDIKSE